MKKKKYPIFLVVFASLTPLFISIKNKSSAVAEMGVPFYKRSLKNYTFGV